MIAMNGDHGADAQALGPAGVAYEVELIDPAAHVLRVRLRVEAPDPSGQRLVLPTWIPGSYLIREFARHIQWVRAFDVNGPLLVQRLDKASWGVAPASGPITVELEVYAWDLSVRAAHFDDTHCFFNGTSLFLSVVGQEHRPHRLRVLPPAFAPDWQVATTLPRRSGPPTGFGDFEAADYDELIDHPVEIGRFELLEFEAGGVPHAVAITGHTALDGPRLVADLAPICAAQIAFFGGVAPMQRYLFLVMVVDNGYGGLEHRSSTSLICSRDGLPLPGMVGQSDGYRGFLGLCSHEYFHTWNVKRIKPAVFLPYDLSKEGHTALLWAFEGITSYYDDLMLIRAGRIDQAAYLELLGRTITGVLRTPGRHVQPLTEASFDAWTRYYRQDENSPNALISYYTKGSLVALLLDLELRLRTGGAGSLDTVMGRLWAEHGAIGVGVPEDGVERLIVEVGGPELQPLLDASLRGLDELPLEAPLAAFGLRLRTRAAEGAEDKGGVPGKRSAASPGWIGASLDSGGRVRTVLRGSPAAAAGLSAGDEVIALDGLRCGGDLLKRVAKMTPGTSVSLTTFRRDTLRSAALVVAAAPHDTAWIEADPEAAPEAVARREAWLSGSGPSLA